MGTGSSRAAVEFECGSDLAIVYGGAAAIGRRATGRRDVIVTRPVGEGNTPRRKGDWREGVRVSEFPERLEEARVAAEWAR